MHNRTEARLSCKRSHRKYVINLDSDVFYKSNYVSYSVFTFEDKNKKATGSGDMKTYNSLKKI